MGSADFSRIVILPHFPAMHDEVRERAKRRVEYAMISTPTRTYFTIVTSARSPIWTLPGMP